MSLIMEAWRRQGYAPAGDEQRLQDYEDKLELERNKQDLIYALKYLPSPDPYANPMLEPQSNTTLPTSLAPTQAPPGDNNGKPDMPTAPSVQVSPATALQINPQTGLADFKYSSQQLSQEAAAAVRAGAYGSYEPSFQSFSSPKVQEWFVDSNGNRLIDAAGREQYIRNTADSATQILNQIDRGEISAKEGAYKAAGFRDAEALRIRETSTTPESLREIARLRGDKPIGDLVNRTKDPAAMRKYVDEKLVPGIEKKFTAQGRSTTPDDLYRGTVESSARPSAEWNEKAAQRVKAARTIRSVGQAVGRTATAVGGAMDAASLANEVGKSARTGNYDNTYQEGSRIAGGWSGAWAGGRMGAAVGTALGGAAGTVLPVVGNGIGASVGGIVGGLAGGASGYFAGSQLGTDIHDFFKR